MRKYQSEGISPAGTFPVLNMMSDSSKYSNQLEIYDFRAFQKSTALTLFFEEEPGQIPGFKSFLVYQKKIIKNQLVPDKEAIAIARLNKDRKDGILHTFMYTGPMGKFFFPVDESMHKIGWDEEGKPTSKINGLRPYPRD